MKITNEHYEYIKSKINNVVIDYSYDSVMEYKQKLINGTIKCNDVNIRLMYDLQRKANLLSFVCDTIYQYADDSHYKTVLLKIGRELKLI